MVQYDSYNWYNMISIFGIEVCTIAIFCMRVIPDTWNTQYNSFQQLYNSYPGYDN